MNEADHLLAAIDEFAGIFSSHFIIQVKLMMDKTNLSKSQAFSLIHMNHHGSCGISEIADELGNTHAASSQMVQRMVDMGLVQRVEAEHDRRAKLISLSPKGKMLIEHMLEDRKKMIEAIIDMLPFEKRASTIESIDLLINSAREYELNQSKNI
jgi:DNA-binding MarR family transcriptional regulator